MPNHNSVVNDPPSHAHNLGFTCGAGYKKRQAGEVHSERKTERIK